MVLGKGTASCVIPAGLVACGAFGHVKHHVLVHIDQTGGHGAPSAVNDIGAGSVDGFAHFLDVVGLHQHTHIALKLVAEAVEDVDVRKQHLYRFLFLGLSLRQLDLRARGYFEKYLRETSAEGVTPPPDKATAFPLFEAAVHAVDTVRDPDDPLAERLALPGALLGGRFSQPELAEGLEVLASAESPYQSLRVVEDGRWETPFRMLQVNEGLDSFQSVWQPTPGLLGTGFYYDYFTLPAWWDENEEGPWRTLVLGLGAGTAFRVLRGATPPGRTLDLWGVEIDDTVVRLGREYFDLEPDGDDVHVISGEDARAALGRLPREFNLICLDAYAYQVEIPPHLCTEEFFGELTEHLVPGGWIAVNVGGFGPEDPVLEAVGRTLARVLSRTGEAGPHVLAVRVAASRNWVIYGRNQLPCPVPGSAAWAIEGPVGDALLPALDLPRAVRVFDAREAGAGLVLTDDRSPMTRLERLSLERGREALALR